MKRFLLIILLFSAVAGAQDFSGNWTGHFSYNNIQAIDVIGSRVYAAAENSVFTYDLNTNQITTLSSVNGLSGEKISAIHYSSSHQMLMIGYENGLIEIKKDNHDDVYRIIDILQKPTITAPQKRINHFNEHEGKLYIAANFGVSEYNLDALEFGESYFIGDNGSQLTVNQTAVHNNMIYAVTQGGGIRYAALDNPNLIDYNQWQIIGDPTWAWLGIANVGGNLYANIVNGLFRIEGSNFVSGQNYPFSFINMWANDQNLVLTTETSAYVFNGNGDLVNTLPNIQDLELNTAAYYNDSFLLGDSKRGLIMFNSTTSSQDILNPEGPLQNRIFNTTAVANELWVVFGEYNISYNPYPLDYRGASHLIGDQWQNYSSEDLFGAAELSHVTINPNDKNNVFISSYLSGLVEIQNGTPVKLYDETDGLDQITGGDEPDFSIRINGSAFDTQGNLWLLNSMVEEGLKVLTPSGEVQGVDLSSVITSATGDVGLGKLVIGQNDIVYFGTPSYGLLAYQTSTGELRNIDSDAGLPVNDVRGLAVDHNNVLWIGTSRGLRVLYNPSSVFTQNSVAAAPIIILEGDVAQELLFEQFVSDIKVDGSNNKWLATATSGVFYVSSNGQEILAHFTRDNSPLPSNNVTSVSIDHQSGRVYFGTVNGLVSYKGSATEPRNNLERVYAYPNPVRPGFEGHVVIDGLMRNSNVKITDIEGNLVYEEVSQGGSILWDTRAFGRHKVASGVYLVLITSEDQVETKVSKIMVIR